MTRQRMFLDISCVEAARKRIRHVYDTFDTVCVQFSGGKDSSAILYLAKEVHEERGLGPVKVIFRDEEMNSPMTMDYINLIKSFDWVDMEHYCLPYAAEIFVLGRRRSIVIWGEDRIKEGRLVRPMPADAITAYHFGLDHSKPLPEHPDYYTMQGKRGLTAFLTGVRASESMVRYRSLVQKLHENYIVTPYKSKKGIPMRFAKVIYDWQTNDVFKFLHEEHNAPYCEYYDVAALTGSNTRIGIPLHAVAIRRIGDVVATEPEFYDALVRCFPDIDAQRRWWPEYDIEKVIKDMADGGWEGIRNGVDTFILGTNYKRVALSYCAEFRKKNAKDPHSYPLSLLARNLLMNEFKTSTVSPVGPKTKAYAVREQEYEEKDEI